MLNSLQESIYWLADEVATDSFFDLSPSQHSGNINVNAKKIRAILTDYFVNEGQVHYKQTTRPLLLSYHNDKHNKI